jgi:diguanylate cyclase (GGDEF)-like protein
MADIGEALDRLEISRRAQAEDKLEELATTDSLTGLKNRRKLNAEIDTEWRRATRQQLPLALLMIDADHFKSYNDGFGHQAGDRNQSALAGFPQLSLVA